jgi:hypothetical protein
MKKVLRNLLFVLLFFTITSNAAVVYTSMNVTSDQSSTWNWVAFGVDADGFGMWVNPAAALRIETYKGPVIGYAEDGKVYLTPLAHGDLISDASAWVAPEAQTYINDATHSSLNGTTCYIGVQLLTSGGDVHYGWMQLEVAADGLSFTLKGMAYEDQPLTAIQAGVIDKQVVYESEVFAENLKLNDGSINTSINVSLLGVEFSVATGELTKDTHFTMQNLPAGLALSINVVDATNAEIKLVGKVSSHSESDTVNNLTVNFLDAAFNGTPASEITKASNPELFVKFFNPYQIVYEDLTDVVCGSGGWAPFESAYFENWFGIWHDGTDMRLETYGQDVIGNIVSGKSYVTPLDFDTPIDSLSDWVTTGAWPNEPYINSASYTVWNGKNKYAGIKLLVDGAELYGWANIEVSADGKTVTVHEWAFNSKPKGSIKAGEKLITSVSDATKNTIGVYPNPFNDYFQVIPGKSMNADATVQIVDLCGKVVYNEKISIKGQTEFTVQPKSLKRGVYFLTVLSQGELYTQKIIRY